MQLLVAMASLDQVFGPRAVVGGLTLRVSIITVN